VERLKSSSANEVARAEAKREADMRDFVERTSAEIEHLKRVIAEKEAIAA
jgi:hypothetical protein